MDKHFRLTIDLQVEITEKVEDKSIKRRGKINSLLKAFLEDNNAILRLYQLWLINEIRHGYLAKEILPKLKEESDTAIIEDVLKECSEDLRNQFQAVLKEDNKATSNNGYLDLDVFWGNLGLFDIENVTFDMVNNAGL
jgi:hypothetical protein